VVGEILTNGALVRGTRVIAEVGKGSAAGFTGVCSKKLALERSVSNFASKMGLGLGVADLGAGRGKKYA